MTKIEIKIVQPNEEKFGDDIVDLCRNDLDKDLYWVSTPYPKLVKAMSDTENQDEILQLFDKHVTLNQSFAEKLKREDVLSTKTLQPLSDLGAEIIALLNHGEFSLIVEDRYWHEPEKLFLILSLTEWPLCTRDGFGGFRKLEF